MSDDTLDEATAQYLKALRSDDALHGDRRRYPRYPFVRERWDCVLKAIACAPWFPYGYQPKWLLRGSSGYLPSRNEDAFLAGVPRVSRAHPSCDTSHSPVRGNGQIGRASCRERV